MNERIKELAHQAFDTAEYPADQQYRIEPNSAFCKKFAELIIKETLEVARAGVEYGDGMEDAVYRYFGVEE